MGIEVRKPVSAVSSSTATIDLVDRSNNSSETVPAGTTTNCSTSGVTKTAPSLDNPVATPPKRFAVKNLSTGTITVSYPDQGGATVNLVMLSGETRTWRQKSTSGWGVESGALAVSALDARFVGLPASPTDGQLMAFNATLGLWAPVNPSGNGEIAYAENVTGTVTTATSNTSVDVPGCAISVPAQTRPVYLSASLQGNGVTAGATNYHCATITEVSNGVDTAISLWGSRTIFIANSLDTCVISGIRIGPTARTRTFKLQVSSLGTSSVTALNSATNRSWIAAEVR